VLPLDSFSAFRWKPKVLYRVHKTSPYFPDLCVTDLDNTNQSYFTRSLLMLSTHLRLGLPSGVSRFGFPIYMHSFSQFALHASPPHPPRLDISNYTWQRVQMMQLLVIQFLHPPIIPSFFDPNTLLSIQFSNTLSLLYRTISKFGKLSNFYNKMMSWKECYKLILSSILR
jgi:hypothetical protein